MNKHELKLSKEHELLAIMMKEPESRFEIFNKVSVDMVSEFHRNIFQEISDSKELDQQAIIHIMGKNDYPDFMELARINADSPTKI